MNKGTEGSMSKTRFAVAVPAYNAGKTIAETLDSLQANDAINEISLVVILNDCSTDDTVTVAQNHWRSKVPLEVWNNKQNIGERKTTNAALSRLSQFADWTFILHADDIVKPNWLTLCIDEIHGASASVASVSSSYDLWWTDTGSIEKGEEYPDLPAVHVQGDRASVIGTIERGCWWHLSGCAIRNSAFLEIGGFKPDMPQLGDWEWLLRCLSKGYSVSYLPRSTMLYRLHGRSVSSRSFAEARDAKEKICILKMMREQGYLDRSDYRLGIRRLMRQLVRRAVVRAVRRDLAGVRSHSSLLFETGTNYVRGQL
jgi:glycosyltransferase involved in cell wall biosynthesis